MFQVRGQSVSRALGDRVARTSREGLVVEGARNEARILARIAELTLTQFEGRYLLVSCPAELHASFVQSLPKGVRDRVGGEFTVDMRSGPREVAAAAEPAQRLIEEREEVATLQLMMEAGPSASVWGEAPTLKALWEGRVRTLAADDALGKPGVRCLNCAAAWEEIKRECPICGGNAIEAVEDVVEIALEKALEQKAALELARSNRARQLMIDRGAMAALLRW